MIYLYSYHVAYALLRFSLLIFLFYALPVLKFGKHGMLKKVQRIYLVMSKGRIILKLSNPFLSVSKVIYSGNVKYLSISEFTHFKCYSDSLNIYNH